MRYVFSIIAPGLVAVCLLAFPSLAQSNGVRQQTDNQLQTHKSVSAVFQIEHRVDSLHRLTQPGYYTALFNPKKRTTSSASATARLAVVPCYSYLCGVIDGEVITIKLGEWNDPAIWSVQRVPTSADIVRVRHRVIIPADYNAQARLVRYDAGGALLPAIRSRLRLGQ